jgi:hypothetical protein
MYSLHRGSGEQELGCVTSTWMYTYGRVTCTEASMKTKPAMMRSSSSHSFSSDDYPTKGPDTEHGIFSGLVVHIIQSKLGSTELDHLYALAESNGADLQSNIENADVIVTRISMRKRLERHIKWEIAVCYFI